MELSCFVTERAFGGGAGFQTLCGHQDAFVPGGGNLVAICFSAWNSISYCHLSCFWVGENCYVVGIVSDVE